MLGEHGTSFAPARVVAVDADGRSRAVTVERILAGSIAQEEGDAYRSRIIEPGLAVDPAGKRAFLVPHHGPVAKVDLSTMSVSYHELDRPSLAQRFLGWLVPAAQAKMIEGPVRSARWLGSGMIAVSGVDYSVATSASGETRMNVRPAGLRLIETRSWRSTMLERESSGFALAPGLVVAQGGRWDYERNRAVGPGLLAFDLAGDERWRLRAGEYRWLATAGAVGYVYLEESQRKVEIVDLATGRVLRTLTSELATDWPQLLAAQSSDW